jgi:hypothetical protein
MIASKVVLNNQYRLKAHPNFGYVKPISIYSTKPTIFKCEYSIDDLYNFAIIKYFKASDLI